MENCNLPNTYWDAYSLSLNGIADAVVVLYNNIDDPVKYGEVAVEVHRLSQALHSREMFTIHIHLQNLQKFIVDLIATEKLTKPISDWLAIVNGRIDWDRVFVLSYLSNECSPRWSLNYNKYVQSHSMEGHPIKEVLMKFQKDHPDLFEGEIINYQKFTDYFHRVVEKPFPIDMIYSLCVLFMNNPLLLPATHYQCSAPRDIETFFFDKKDFVEVFELRTQALAYLCDVVKDDEDYRVFRVMITRAMRISAWIGLPRTEEYFKFLRHTEIREYYDFHQNFSRCLACDVKMAHCPSMSYCYQEGKFCTRHSIARKDYSWTTQDYMEIYCLRSHELIEDVYKFFAGTYDAENIISESEFISKVNFGISQMQMPAPDLRVPPPERGYYRPRPFVGFHWDDEAFLQTYDQLESEEDISGFNLTLYALILSGHFTHALCWYVHGRERNSVYDMIEEIPIQTFITYPSHGDLNHYIDYVFRQFRLGLPASFKTMKEVGMEAGTVESDFLSGSCFYNDQPPDVESDEEPDFNLANLLERL